MISIYVKNVMNLKKAQNLVLIPSKKLKLLILEFKNAKEEVLALNLLLKKNKSSKHLNLSTVSPLLLITTKVIIKDPMVLIEECICSIINL